jgi:2-keto-4-pentenoate hydratase/2-oxohepta-3-ene-1,7-dioic acid hydratase in catechol pathway
MRIVRFLKGGHPVYGLVEAEGIVPLSDAPWETGGKPSPAGAPVPRRGAALLAPCAPSKILCIGRNYRAHVKELGSEIPKEPVVFLKAPSSVLPHHGTVLLPAESTRVDFEGELAIVIGKRCRRVPASDWKDVVFGYTAAFDITARDLQKTDGQWWRAKGFDTFCPLGPCIETDIDPSSLALETLVDGETKQHGNTADMMFDFGTMISWVSAAMTLEPGDVILTGTPEGVAPLVPGQTLELRIEKVGALRVTVAREAG